MALIDTVKHALGIYYTEQTKDAEIQTIIDGAKSMLLSAGVPSADLTDDSESPQAVQAIIIYAKEAVNTDPTEMRINPMLVNLIQQKLDGKLPPSVFQAKAVSKNRFGIITKDMWYKIHPLPCLYS